MRTDAAERALTELVASTTDVDVAAQLAEWSHVTLDVQPSSTSALTGSRRDLFERLLAQHHIDADPARPLARRTTATGPTSFSQQMQWDFHERGNFPTMCIDATAFALRGPLDERALQQALAALVTRHASLRTSFAVERGRLVQTIHDRGPALELVDLSRLDDGARRAEADRLFAAASRPHDLTREVFRAQLLRFDAHDHVLLLSPHHIVIDGFAWDVLDADLAALYRAAASSTAPTLAPIAITFADFCFWQRTLEHRPIGRAQLAFWARAITDYAGLEVAGDRRSVTRGAVGMAMDTYEPGDVSIEIDGTRWTQIEQLAARVGTTPYTIVATSFLLLLSRWAGRADVCTLSGNYQRQRSGTELAIGNFVTQYPLRLVFDESATLEAAVRHCQATVAEHRAHSQVAPTSAIAALPEWSRYNLNYLEAPAAAPLDYGAVTIERLGWNVLPHRTAHDLGLFLRQSASGIRGKLVYNAERFSPQIAARAAARLGELLQWITTTPAMRVRDLPSAP